MNLWVGVIGTLLGTVLGSSATFLIQWTQERRRRRSENLQVRRQAYLKYLEAVSQLYRGIRQAYKDERIIEDATAFRALLASLDPTTAQSALEAIRLTCAQEGIKAAENLWAHLRRDGVAFGSRSGGARYRLWVDEYWAKREALLTAARADLGIEERPAPVRRIRSRKGLQL